MTLLTNLIILILIQDRLILYVIIDFINSSITNWYLLYDFLLVAFITKLLDKLEKHFSYYSKVIIYIKLGSVSSSLNMLADLDTKTKITNTTTKIRLPALFTFFSIISLLYSSVLHFCVPVSIALANFWTFYTNLIIPSTGFPLFYHSFMQNQVKILFPWPVSLVLIVVFFLIYYSLSCFQFLRLNFPVQKYD